jgi:hypothetical protein
MDPRLMEILKKAKQIDKAAEKFDGSAPKKSNSRGLMDQISGDQLITAEEMAHSGGRMMESSVTNIKKDIGNPSYNSAVKNSKLPAAIQKAMLENPIPQGDINYGTGVDEEAIRQIRGSDKISEDRGSYYNEEDEVDMYDKPVRRTETKKKVIREQVNQPVDIDESYIRKLIASEIGKALPKIIEHYFDSRLVKENVQFKAGSTTFSGTVMPMPKVKGKG